MTSTICCKRKKNIWVLCWSLPLVLHDYSACVKWYSHACGFVRLYLGIAGGLATNSGVFQVDRVQDSSRTAAGQGDVDSVFMTLMLGAHTQSRLVHIVSPLNFWCEDADQVIITTTLLSTFTLIRIEKMHYVFMYGTVWKYSCGKCQSLVLGKYQNITMCPSESVRDEHVRGWMVSVRVSTAHMPKQK